MSSLDRELLELCASNNLSFDSLQEKINALGPRLSSQNPLCVHRVCGNKNATLEIVQLLHNKWPGLLHNTWPGALQLRNDDGWLPFHILCCNEALDETASLDILRFMLSIDPTLPRELVGNDGSPPIHYAVQYKSAAFCKELIDAYPESLRIVGGGMLPIHLACSGNQDDIADAIQHMLEVDSELINAEDHHRHLPIHIAAWFGTTKSIELLLHYDPDAASKETNDGSRQLPLHVACGAAYNLNLSSIQALYDAYPEAILIRDEDREAPLDFARSEENTIIVDFLETQLVYARQASEDLTAMTTLDDDGWLPLHRALKDNVSLGSIKLFARANPATVQVSDRKGAYPVHIACEFSSVKVVKYLVELAGDTLNSVDANNNSPLHYACCGGNLGNVKYLLEVNVPSVSERNNYNKLAIHLLLECGDNILDRESLEYVETVYQLLLANPEVVRNFMPHQLRQKEIATANAKIDANSKKRPRDSLFSTACEFVLSTKRRYFGAWTGSVWEDERCDDQHNRRRHEAARRREAAAAQRRRREAAQKIILIQRRHRRRREAAQKIILIQRRHRRRREAAKAVQREQTSCLLRQEQSNLAIQQHNEHHYHEHHQHDHHQHDHHHHVGMRDNIKFAIGGFAIGGLVVRMLKL